MKQVLSVSALLIAAVFVALGQVGVETRASANFERNVIEVNRAWVEAFAHCDISTLSKIAADDCIITTEYGDVVSKAQFIKLIQSQQPEDCASENLATDDVKVRSFGGTFIVTGRMTKTDKGKSLGLRYTNVYIRRSGRWQLVASQATHVASVSIKVEVAPPKPPK